MKGVFKENKEIKFLKVEFSNFFEKEKSTCSRKTGDYSS
jgi:hypothetical protein